MEGRRKEKTWDEKERGTNERRREGGEGEERRRSEGE